MNKIDELIISTAKAEGLKDAQSIVIFDDPHADLFRAALEASARDRGCQIYIGSRTATQARNSAKLADDFLMRSRVHIGGLDGSLRLDEFFLTVVNAGQNPNFAKKVLVLSHLPKSLGELEYLVSSLAPFGPNVTFVGGANTKHMSRNQNVILEQALGQCQATRGVGKYRCLVGKQEVMDQIVSESTLIEVSSYAPTIQNSKYGKIAGIGGVFGGAKIDHGGEFLGEVASADIYRIVSDYRRGFDDAPRIVDLGCGNGAVSRQLFAELEDATIFATDISADACASAAITLAPEIKAGKVQVSWADAAQDIPSNWADFVLLNPPFHEGTRIDATMIKNLLVAAHRILCPGGDLYLVHNSHLRYRPEIEKSFDRVRELDRNSKFTVLQARK
ncbi:class I SAM-dependent methyltransferase [Arcanobacterium ihumii]|uniref:class I SAM-dependent methyltransferase n=1 Tax=Arcanobacterium ihumii TaxID=2138162 RepID=UPI000F51C700|nr:methyltransferase [Arcanobacterium ihumii]